MTKRLLLLLTLPAATAFAAGPKITELRFGNEPWHLALALDGMKPVEGAASGPDRQVSTYNNGNGIVLSVIVENAHEPATMASCRNVFAQRKANGIAGMPTLKETQGQRGEAATQEYDVRPEFRGKPIVQHNAFSCRVRGTYYIDTHASMIGYRPSDHEALIAALDRVAIVD